MAQTKKGPAARTAGHSSSKKQNKTKPDNPISSPGKGKPSIFLESALMYARNGFPVFPCEERGKAPQGLLAPNGYKDATTNPKVIKKWWCNGHDWNIGLVPPKGMAILDIDPRNGGEESWEKIQRRLSTKGLRSEGLRAYTGGGGEHIVLNNVPERLPGKLAKGIDIKRNGYVVAAPSIHPDTGKRYRWVGGWNPKGILNWPSDLKPLRQAPENNKKNTGEKNKDLLTLSQVRKLLKQVDPDDYDNWIEIGMGLKADYPDEGFDLWMKWSSKSKKFPGERAARAKWRSFRGEGRTIGTLIYLAGGKIPKTSPREDFAPAEQEAPEVQEEIEKGKKEKKAREGELVLVNLADVEEKKIDWLVPGYLAKGMLHCVAGFGGEGKSNVVSAIIASITNGKDIVSGKRLVDGASKVLMVTEEPLAYQTLPRFRLAGADISKVRVIDSVRSKVEGKEKVIAWNLQDHLRQVQELVSRDRKFRVLVIDPIGSYMTGKKKTVDTWKDSDVRDVLRPWQELAEKENLAVVFIAHFNKGKTARAAEKVTGSSAFTTVTRITYLVGKPPLEWMGQFGLEPPKDGGADRVLMSIKRNVGKEPDLLVFSCDPVPGEDAPEVKFKGTIPVQYAADLEKVVMHEANGGAYDGGQKSTMLELVKEQPGITSTELVELMGIKIQNLPPVASLLIEAKKVIRVKKGREVHWYLPGQEFEEEANEDLF